MFQFVTDVNQCQRLSMSGNVCFSSRESLWTVGHRMTSAEEAGPDMIVIQQVN